MHAPQPLVLVRDLSKSHGQTRALRGVNLDIPEGCIFGLLGPNGSGKTTTLECLLGLRRPDTGSVRIGGIDALRQPAAARHLVGALVQASGLQPDITPREALRLFSSLHKVPCNTEVLLGRLRLTAKADAPFDTLSAGHKQSLLLGLALCHLPRLLVLDEPFAGLDPAARGELHATLRELRQTGGTLLLSTHDLADAAELCDQIAILNEGVVVAAGAPTGLLSEHRIPHHVVLTTASPVTAGLFRGLAEVGAARGQGEGWSLSTHAPQACIQSVVTTLAAAGNGLVELRVEPPSLAELYHRLTGRNWVREAGEDAP